MLFCECCLLAFEYLVGMRGGGREDKVGGLEVWRETWWCVERCSVSGMEWCRVG